MAGTFRQYNPALNLVSFDAIQLVNFAPGTHIKCSRNSDAFTMSVGAGGAVTRVRNNDRTGQVSVTLKAEAPENDLLSARAIVDEDTGLGFGTLSVRNANSTTFADGTIAWIKKIPDVEQGDDGPVREWVFDCADLELFVGGALF